MEQDESTRIVLTNEGFSKHFRNAFASLEEQAQNNSAGGCCRPVSLKTCIQNVYTEKQCIFLAHVWMLTEERWITKRSGPCDDKLPCPNPSVGDIWEDYQFDLPSTETIMNSREKSISRDLDHTRRHVCAQCQKDEQKSCSHDRNPGSIVTWSQLTMKRSTISFSLVHPATFQTIIATTPERTKCLQFDDVWPADQSNLDQILDKCRGLPDEFRREMNSLFSSRRKSDKVLRVKCLIECLRIEKVTYQLSGYPGRVKHIERSSTD